MKANGKYDTYLLYEYMKKVSFTVRILVKLKENVDQKLLNEVAQEAITRFPYFAVKVRVDDSGSFAYRRSSVRCHTRWILDPALMIEAYSCSDRGNQCSHPSGNS